MTSLRLVGPSLRLHNKQNSYKLDNLLIKRYGNKLGKERLKISWHICMKPENAAQNAFILKGSL